MRGEDMPLGRYRTKAPVLVVGLAGEARCGKNTAAEALVGFKPVAFVDTLRQIVRWTLNDLVAWPDGMTDILDEQKDIPFPHPIGPLTAGQAKRWACAICANTWYTPVNGKPVLPRLEACAASVLVGQTFDTGRRLLQVIGTDVLRAACGPYIFADMAWQNRISNATVPLVFTDCRFPEERELIRDTGGLLIRLRRVDPNAQTGSPLVPSHTSETSFGDDSEYDAIISAWSFDPLHFDDDRRKFQAAVFGAVTELHTIMTRRL